MTERNEPRPLQLAAVEIMTDYDGLIRLTDIDGARLHYYLDSSGVLIFGRPYIARNMGGPGYVHLFWPANPGEPPIVLKVAE